jgi:hypothetical protein
MRYTLNVLEINPNVNVYPIRRQQLSRKSLHDMLILFTLEDIQRHVFNFMINKNSVSRRKSKLL